METKEKKGLGVMGLLILVLVISVFVLNHRISNLESRLRIAETRIDTYEHCVIPCFTDNVNYFRQKEKLAVVKPYEYLGSKTVSVK